MKTLKSFLAWTGAIIVVAISIVVTLFLIGVVLRIVQWNMGADVPTIFDPGSWF